MNRQIKTEMLPCEFRDYIEDRKPNDIIYNNDNNKNEPYNPLRVNCHFTGVSVTFNPNIIHLNGQYGKISLCHVKKVVATPSVVGDIATVCCKIFGVEAKHILIMR